MISGIIVAAGRGRRMGASENKVFLKLLGRTVIEHTVAVFEKCRDIDEIIVVTGKEDILRCKNLLKRTAKQLKIIAGGETRQQSVYNGIQAAEGDIVAIHDGARPLVTPELVSQAVDACRKYKAAALGVPAKDTIKLADADGFIEKTLERSRTYNIQTPQVFDKELIKKAHENGKDTEATDDCMLAEADGARVKIVDGSYENIKLTTPEDMTAAEAILEKRKIQAKKARREICVISE